jgi:hypothetical protein
MVAAREVGFVRLGNPETSIDISVHRRLAVNLSRRLGGIIWLALNCGDTHRQGIPVGVETAFTLRTALCSRLYALYYFDPQPLKEGRLAKRTSILHEVQYQVRLNESFSKAEHRNSIPHQLENDRQCLHIGILSLAQIWNSHNSMHHGFSETMSSDVQRMDVRDKSTAPEIHSERRGVLLSTSQNSEQL